MIFHQIGIYEVSYCTGMSIDKLWSLCCNTKYHQNMHLGYEDDFELVYMGHGFIPQEAQPSGDPRWI